MKQNDWLQIETGISQAYWCKLLNEHSAIYSEAVVDTSGEKHTISWFDEMFYGGIRFPLVPGRPATFLVTGPPGSGKSTLGLEFCYRLADLECRNERHCNSKKNPWLCLYVSADMSAQQVFQKVCSFGWKNAGDRFYIGMDKIPESFGTHGLVIVRGAESLRQQPGIGESVRKVLSEGLDLLEFIPDEISGPVDLSKVAKRFVGWIPSRDPLRQAFKKVMPDVVVVDSLNSLDLAERASYFEQFLNAASGHTRIVVFILDSHRINGTHDFWEYMCDFVIRVDYDSTKDYFLRNIEIIKARYQDNVLGKQQMKIYPSKCEACPNSTIEECKRSVDRCQLASKSMRRGHPYRYEGGIFVFPSIHYYLSKYKRMSPDVEPTSVDTLPSRLNDIVKQVDQTQKGIIPEGRCTAFVGSRGGHKSHVDYLHLLYRLWKYNESALVVSLRDDEEMIRKTLYNILRQEFKEDNPKRKVTEYEVMDKLEILYYPPGYITPEEFYRRMFMSVYRLKKSNPKEKLTVLFNSLDQLSARFPLCAEQDIFIPGIIASLSGEHATSIFIAVDERGQPEKQYGLIPMADLVLSFRRRRFTLGDYYYHLKSVGNEKAKRDLREEEIVQKKETVVLQVLRFAGGEMAGRAGILELVTHPEDSLYSKAGLHFTPLVPG